MYFVSLLYHPLLNKLYPVKACINISYVQLHMDRKLQNISYKYEAFASRLTVVSREAKEEVPRDEHT